MVDLPYPEPHRPGFGGRLLRIVHAGARHTLGTVDELAAAWHRRGVDAIAGTDPLWVAIGDSLTQGVGCNSIDGSFVSQVSARLADAGRAHGVVNIARSGATVADVIDRQLPILDLLPAVALVTCTAGSNDLLRSTRIRVTERRVAELAALLPTGSVLGALPDGGSLLARRFNRSLRSIAADHGHRVAEVNQHLTTWRGRSARDRFHPNELGYEAWTSAFWDALATSSP